MCERERKKKGGVGITSRPSRSLESDTDGPNMGDVSAWRTSGIYCRGESQTVNYRATAAIIFHQERWGPEINRFAHKNNPSENMTPLLHAELGNHSEIEPVCLRASVCMCVRERVCVYDCV